MPTDTSGMLGSSDILFGCPSAQNAAGIGGNVGEHHAGVLVLDSAQGFGTGSGGRSLPAHALAGKGAEHPPAVPERVQVRLTRDPGQFMAGNLGNAEAGP